MIKHPCLSAIKCNAEIRRRPKGQGCSARRECTSKTQKWGFRGKWPFSEKFPNSVAKVFMTTPFTFCVRISRRSSAEKWLKRCVASVTKHSAKCSFFAVPFRVRLVEGAKSLRRSVPRDPTSPCKISFQSLPICQSYSWKSHFPRSQCLRHIINRNFIPCLRRKQSWNKNGLVSQVANRTDNA